MTDTARTGKKDTGSFSDVSGARVFFERLNQIIPKDLSRTVDTQLGQIPPAGFMGLALGAMGISAMLTVFNERKGWAVFFGNWVPSLLCLTVYAKLVKLEQAQQQQKSPTVH